VLAIPLQSLPSAWEELAPGLAVAAVVALFAATVLAWWLAGSIARPIRAVTQAMARVASGQPQQPIPAEGVEEVAQLAQGFNTMVREVERSQTTLRDFVANASHELRTPLTAIQGFSQAVMDGVLEAPEPTRDAAALIHREAERMRRLVEDLLLLSKMEARDRTAPHGTVDVAELLDTIAQRLQLVARDRGLHLVLELPERLLADGDAAQLEHLFGNLLENAAKYSPDGGTITVRAALVSNAAGRGTRPGAPQLGSRSAGGPGSARPLVSVMVHNTGSYIPPEDLPHIFDRFYRVDKSRSRQVAGSGLGLAIAREVVERHRGTIRAESDPVAGTSFVVTLPAAATPATGPTTTSEPTGVVPRSGALGRVAALRPGWARPIAITRPSRQA
jgi:signal transduction histidine kinase